MYRRHDSLSGIVVCDQEYPQRVAFALLGQLMQKFEAQYQCVVMHF